MKNLKCKISKVLNLLFSQSLILFVVSCALVLWCSGALVFAQEEALELGEIVVTATKEEKPVKDVPASVEIIGKDEIKDLNVKTTTDAVKSLLGVSTKGAKGLNELYPGIRLRGLSGDRVLILLDGKKIPEYQWQRIPVDSVERIEVVKGPFSSLYGSEAMGGVVNIITKKSKEGLKITQKIGYETHNTKIFGHSMYGKSGKTGFSLNLQKRETDGYPSQDKTKTGTKVESSTAPVVTGWKNTYDKYGKTQYLIGNSGKNWFSDESYDLKLTYDISQKQDLALDLSFREYNYGYQKGESFLYDTSGIPFYGIEDNTTLQIQDAGKIYEIKVKQSDFIDSFGGNPSHSIGLTYNNKIKEDLKLKSYLNFAKAENWYNDPAGKITEAPKRGYHFETQLSSLYKKHYLISGVYYENEDQTSEKWYISDWQNKNSKEELDRLQKGEADKYALFLQDEINFGENLSIFAGLRYDKWEFSGDAKFRAKKGAALIYDEYKKKSKDQISPKLSILYKPQDNTTIRASVGTGFRAPGIGDLVTTWAYGTKLHLANPELEPESNNYYELGTEYKLKNIVIKGTYFNNKLKDLIDNRDFTTDQVTDYNTQHGTSWSSIVLKDNISEAKIQGYEFEVRSKINKDLTIFANWTKLDSEVTAHKTKPNVVGKKITYTPEEKWAIGIDYKKNKLTTTLRGNYTGDCFTVDDNSDTKNGVYGSYDSYAIWDTKISYDFAGTIASISVDNIFDKKYYEYYPNPGRLIGLHIERGFDIK